MPTPSIDVPTEYESELFNDSYRRCLSNTGRDTGFLARFYELFLSSSPEVAEKFRHTDFNRQTTALKSSLFILMLASQRRAVVIEHLERLAELHSHKHLDIRPQLYDLWLDSLLQAVQEFDHLYDHHIEAAWRSVLGYGIEFMRSRY